jgi:hypothetical protein
VRPPGGLDELGEAGRAAWSAHVERLVETIATDLQANGQAPQGIGDAGEGPMRVRTLEWPAFPARIAAVLGRRAAMEGLDRHDPERGDVGRADQEEYLEWRLVRREGKPVAIEMTTELRDHWTVLAAHEPQRVLALAGSFAGDEAEAPAVLLYGMGLDQVLAATPAERGLAFARTMLPGDGLEASEWRFSPYNDGRTALCCMVHRSNDLSAMLRLVLGAARPLVVEDSITDERRYPSGSEAIASHAVSAQDGRNSDPLIVERVVRFVTEGRRVIFDDPIGVYLGQIQLYELVQPDGEDVPAEWVRLSRGTAAADAADGRSRAQRLEFALPDDADFSLDDLVVRRTGEKLRFGAQLAALVELCAYVRTGAASGDRR